MKRKYFPVNFIFLFFAVFFTCSNKYENTALNGHWEGKVSSMGRSLGIVFDISRDKFLYDIPELGLFGERVSKWESKGNDVEFEIEGRENIQVSGTLINNSIKAEVESDEKILLSLERTSGVPVFYEEEEITYKSDDAVISGTLIKPLGPLPHAVIVFVHGSGKMTRETMRSRAYMFVQNGSAALIFDRRGKGSSEGDTSRILPVSVMTDDVIAAVNFLKSRKDVDKEKIGLYGLSQGGWVIPNAASMCSDVKFIIAVSAPGITPDEQNEFVVDNMVNKYVSKFIYKDKWTGESDSTLDNYMKKEADYRETAKKDSPEVVPGFSWFNPIPAWERVSVPVLAIWGGSDEIVPADVSYKNIQDALVKSGNNNFTLKSFEGANHVIKLPGNEDKFAGKWEITAPGSNEFIIKWFKSTILEN